MSDKTFSVNSNSRRTTIFEWLFLTALVLGYYSWLSVNTVYSVSENGRLLDVFEGDEFVHFSVVRHALDERTVCIDFPYYGHFYFNLVLFPLLVFQKFAPVSDTLLILALRYASVIPAILTVFATFFLGRRYFGRGVAWLGALLLMIVPYSFNYWSVVSHPDTLQMVTIAGGVIGCCEFLLSRKKKWLIFAAVSAGLAFSTKYGGILLMPIIWLLCLVHVNGSSLPLTFDVLRWEKIRALALSVIATSAAFFVSFILTSPCSFVGGQFIEGVLVQSQWTNAGHVFVTGGSPFEWFGILFSPDLLGLVGGLLLVATLAAYFMELWRRDAVNLLSSRSVLWAWILLYFLYTFFRVNIRVDRHLLVVIPFAFLLIADFLIALSAYLRERLKGNFVYYILAGVVALTCAIEIRNGFARQIDMIEAMNAREQGNYAVEAGLWLEHNYSPSTRILYDKYSYIPPVFTRVRGSYGITEDLLSSFNPRVVVVNVSIRDIFKNAEDAKLYAEGEEKFMVIHDFYRQMEAEELGYVLVQDFGRVQIYEKERMP